MKHFLAAACAIFIAASASAQQALWGGPQVVSPEINPDNTVTFRLQAPKAVKVQVAGDFIGSPGIAEMTEVDGVWEYTTEPLAPELYSYSFIVDGLVIRDPANVYMNRDVASVTNIFIVGGGRADLYKVNDVPHGTVSRIWYHSPTLNMDRRMTVYTPAGYDRNRKQKYPVFYLLHGAGGDEEAWMALGRTAQVMDNLIAQGNAEPMIVVMTNGNAGEQAAAGESHEGFRKPGMQQRGMMDGGFEASFPDVVNYIEKNFRVYKDKSHRAVAGLSMGGFHSLHISRYYPDMFDYVGLFSAAIFPREGSSPVYSNIEQTLDVQFAKKPALYWIAIGKSDFLYDANVKYRKLLDSKGYPYVYFENEDGHIWRNWRIYLTEFVPQLFK